jgi:hypothetical protein
MASREEPSGAMDFCDSSLRIKGMGKAIYKRDLKFLSGATQREIAFVGVSSSLVSRPSAARFG